MITGCSCFTGCISDSNVVASKLDSVITEYSTVKQVSTGDAMSPETPSGVLFEPTSA